VAIVFAMVFAIPGEYEQQLVFTIVGALNNFIFEHVDGVEQHFFGLFKLIFARLHIHFGIVFVELVQRKTHGQDQHECILCGEHFLVFVLGFRLCEVRGHLSLSLQSFAKP
jgi:hypothetical protein